MIIKNLNKEIMFIVNKKEIKFENIYLNFEKYSYQKIYKRLIKIFQEKQYSAEVLFIEDYEATFIDIILLLVLTKLNKKFIYNNENYELSFTYAIPLYKEHVLFDFVIKNLSLCIKNRQIVFLPHNSLYLYKKINEIHLNKIFKDEKRTLLKNKDIKIIKTKFNKDFFDFWKNYDKTRFGENQSNDFQKFFKILYNKFNFHLYKYVLDNDIIAYNVCYLSNEQKVIYDVLFPWINSKKVYRVGIFSMLYNLKQAFHMDWGYSICYGIYDYKNKILNKLEN